jgi:signal transduction histidine kinase
MTELLKDRLKVGQRVKFRRSHDKFVELTGTITDIPKGSADVVRIKTEADGKNVEVSGIEEAHAGDVTVLKDQPALPAPSVNAQQQRERNRIAAEQAAEERERNRIAAEQEAPEAPARPVTRLP